jgi:hypothetical protein
MEAVRTSETQVYSHEITSQKAVIFKKLVTSRGNSDSNQQPAGSFSARDKAQQAVHRTFSLTE